MNALPLPTNYTRCTSDSCPVRRECMRHVEAPPVPTPAGWSWEYKPYRWMLADAGRVVCEGRL